MMMHDSTCYLGSNSRLLQLNFRPQVTGARWRKVCFQFSSCVQMGVDPLSSLSSCEPKSELVAGAHTLTHCWEPSQLLRQNQPRLMTPQVSSQHSFFAYFAHLGEIHRQYFWAF